MKKRFVSVILFLAASVYLSYRHLSIDELEQTATNELSPINGPSSVFTNTESSFEIKKLSEYSEEYAECKTKEKNLKININNSLVTIKSELVNDLKNGKTDTDLYFYRHFSETLNRDFENLLLQAKLDIEREKYHYSDNIELLKKWSGLEVIKTFSAANIDDIIHSLKTLKNHTPDVKVSLHLNNAIEKSDVLSLLQNTTFFHTYLQSPFLIEGTPLSPSNLFVLTAAALDLYEFSQAITLQSFNVNDLAVAIKNEMPFDYLHLLIEQTNNIEDMPTLHQSKYESYSNIADLAVATHNVPLLRLLATYGVNPINKPGILTGLDLAILNIPKSISANSSKELLASKYIETIEYLIAKGYRAHGFKTSKNGQSEIIFQAPFKRKLESEAVLQPELKDLLQSIQLLSDSNQIANTPDDHSVISRAAQSIEQEKKALNKWAKKCESLKKAIRLEEGFSDHLDAKRIIDNFKGKENAALALQNIDPVLVNLWNRYHGSDSDSTLNAETTFIRWLREKNYSKALDYSATTPLSEKATTILLSSLSRYPEEVLPIWQARIAHAPPSRLLSFTRLSFLQWEYLAKEGFDFSTEDKFGNDFFLPAALHSHEAIELLLAYGFKPKTHNLGVDVVDLLLEESYKRGRLNPSLLAMLDKIDHIEPNHYSRIKRLKTYFPEQYNKLVDFDESYIPPNNTKMNSFMLKNF